MIGVCGGERSGENEQGNDRDCQNQGADNPPPAVGVAAHPALEGGHDTDQRRNAAGQGDEEGEEAAVTTAQYLDGCQGDQEKEGRHDGRIEYVDDGALHCLPLKAFA